MTDFSVISPEQARELAALEHFFRRIVSTAVTNQYQGQDGLRLVEIRNILEEIPTDVLIFLNEDLPRNPDLRGVHES
jgi:hypothetical protein